MDQIENFSIIKRNNQDSRHELGKEELISCRICYDDTVYGKLISPCNCVGSHANVHLSCLEQWLSISNSNNCDICNYTYETVNHYVTMNEWLREKKNRLILYQQVTVMLFFVCIWGFVLAICVLKMVECFLDITDSNSLCNGVLMGIISIIMVIMLWFRLYVFISLWTQVKIETRLDKKYLNKNKDIVIVV